MDKQLTGNTRYRQTIFGKLVLQVEESYYDRDPHGGEERVRWRDATFADYQSEGRPTKHQGSAS